MAVRIQLIDHERGRGVTLGFTAGETQGEIRTSLDPSGWVRVTVALGGEDVFRAWLDRPYEEYHLWPDNAAASPDEDPPGHIGKRRNWISLSAAAWPVLAPQGWLTIAVAGIERRRKPWTRIRRYWSRKGAFAAPQQVWESP